MTQLVAPETCEIKRVFVSPTARGRGVARTLCRAAIDWAREAGYRRMVLDTMRSLPEAIALYQGMGFRTTDPYHEMPPEFAPLVLYFEYPL